MWLVAFNTIIDFTLTYLSGFELWQFMFRATSQSRQTSFVTRFKKLDRNIRNQRLWQTLLLCGPLMLSGVASIVKTYVSEYSCSARGTIDMSPASLSSW